MKKFTLGLTNVGAGPVNSLAKNSRESHVIEEPCWVLRTCKHQVNVIGFLQGTIIMEKAEPKSCEHKEKELNVLIWAGECGP